MNSQNAELKMSESESRMMEIIRKFCCCNGERSMDYDRLIRGEQNEEPYTMANSNGGPAFASTRTGMSDRSLAVNQQTKSREEEEEDLMNKILDRTQQSIIDVANLENSSLDFDAIQRSRLYAEAIKRHDAQTDRRKAADSEISHFTLLSNVGTRAHELIGQPAQRLDQEELTLLCRASELFLEAHRLGAQIECKEDLIVYMSLDD